MNTLTNKSPSTPSNVTSSPNVLLSNNQDRKQFILQYLSRMLKWRQLDFTSALTQMTQLIYNPSLVFKNARNRKFIKDRYARDDPAFVLLLGLFMLCIGFAYALAFHSVTISNYLSLIGYMFFFDFLFIGIFISTITWFISNKFLMNSEDNESVEWLFAFDIHCNAFFPLFLLLYVIQYILLPILTLENIFCLLLSNILFTFAFGYYFYITFRGFIELHFLKNQEIYLYPIAFIIIGFFISVFSSFNPTRFIISLYINP
ncbi:hypothetical protein ABK040_001108 [Willaertia magna]